ncbi:DUF6299 family protein [Streptomyces sp. NPDC048111]|uniref:DUF6299 family protein n=1 Tax=Streptomyces sp. NPDC048111 TaxID=3365500 RepID=UPI00371AFFDC
MRVRLVAAGAVAAAGALLGMAAGPACAASGSVSADPAGTVSRDGTITVSGTYRCSGASGRGPVVVSSSVGSATVRQGLQGIAAQCDGAQHTWVNHGKLAYGGPMTPGPTDVQASLVRLDMSSGLPLPSVIAMDRRQVDLRPAAD